MADLAGRPAPVADAPNPPVSWIKKRPALFRLALVVLAAILVIVGLALGDTEDILFKGSIL